MKGQLEVVQFVNFIVFKCGSFSILQSIKRVITTSISNETSGSPQAREVLKHLSGPFKEGLSREVEPLSLMSVSECLGILFLLELNLLLLNSDYPCIPLNRDQ